MARKLTDEQRKPLERKSPLRRTAIKRKRRKDDKPEIRLEYMWQHQICAVTWAKPWQFGVILDPHHLVPGNGRLDDERCLLSLDRWVHDHFHSGGALGMDGERLEDLIPGHLLWCKKEADPKLYDEEFICRLLGRESLPERWIPIRPPAWVFALREKNGR